MQFEQPDYPDYQELMKHYADNTYETTFDIFFMRNIYKYFSFMELSKFIKLVRFLCKLFVFRKEELPYLIINKNLLNARQDYLDQIQLRENIIDTYFFAIRNDRDKMLMVNNLLFLFLNAKVR